MTLYIEELRFKAHLGILEKERQNPQTVQIDMTLTYDYSAPETFVDYALVAKEVETLLRRERFGLIEEAIEAIFCLFQEKFPAVTSARVKICKPDILPNCRVCAENFRRFL